MGGHSTHSTGPLLFLQEEATHVGDTCIQNLCGVLTLLWNWCSLGYGHWKTHDTGRDLLVFSFRKDPLMVAPPVLLTLKDSWNLVPVGPIWVEGCQFTAHLL
jgi:hypothetical protein